VTPGACSRNGHRCYGSGLYLTESRISRPRRPNIITEQFTVWIGALLGWREVRLLISAVNL